MAKATDEHLLSRKASHLTKSDSEYKTGVAEDESIQGVWLTGGLEPAGGVET